MPTYEYACKYCGHNFETVMSIKDDIIAECPKCFMKGSNRLISSGTSFSLKGSGWAADNYGNTKT
jgi:putative FmdB family regulatory protein